ncbi:hypothetical protein [Atopobium sp. oral taxon 416]|uniref:hypothetical protein n=1 Tax=Atopobium sp. oral taxon 416 TaxID=712157 RepID=UPI001BAC79A3|nr:hypothetical protein [Atopobium sp. oral taxon 416]QUC04420.1 hypothetical protein J4859_05675 [Atopobium sp. oral taxon 416]
MTIPSLAIHMNREVNESFGPDRTVDLCPLFSAGEPKQGPLDKLIAEELSCELDAILARDLYLVNRQKPTVWGAVQEFVSAPHLDDLQSAYAGLQAFLGSDNEHGVSVYVCFDNEEVGSSTKQGALFAFLHDTLVRINKTLGKTEEKVLPLGGAVFPRKFCGNPHAKHPNHPEVADATNTCIPQQGPGDQRGGQPALYGRRVQPGSAE